MKRKNSIYRYRDAESDTAQISGLASIVGISFFAFTDDAFLISSVTGFALNIISSIFGFGDISAIGGYMAVGLLSVKYWWYTSRILKNES